MVMALIPGSRSGSRWGPTLNDYLDLPEANLEFRRLSDEATMRLAIKKLLYNPEAVTLDTLETIMSTTHRPRTLGLLVDKNAIGGCMKLLESYIGRDCSNGSLLEHAFGFQALHVLALVLQAGLLGSHYFEGLPLNSTEGMEQTWDVKAPAMHAKFLAILSGLVFENTLRLNESDPRLLDYQIEWVQNSCGDERACLPAIGGFMYRNATFILELLFKDRKMFLECCFRTRAPGWSILMYMIQWMLDDKSYEAHNRVPRLWQEYRDIIFRYCLVSGFKEDGLMEGLCCEYAKPHASIPVGKPTVVDFEDAQLIQLAFSRKHRPNNGGTHRRSLTYGVALVRYVRDNLASYPSLQLAINEAIAEVIWDVLVCVGHDNRWEDIDAYMSISYGEFHQMLRQKDADLTSKVITIMQKYDLVDMFGRYVLLPSYLRKNHPDILNAGKFFSCKYCCTRKHVNPPP
ncbi:hypothetical protein FRC12_005650 [Ceratobasidium sp. 428]|nr:hypothetical protein FRC12_005650 [Ceratobasidium sp. 428]